jgi:hypothetical protein
MRRTFAVFAPPLLCALTLLPPGEAAGPPVGASGKMVFDEVADGLRKYRTEKDAGKRFGRLDRLARTHDPRVGIVLGELLGGHDGDDRLEAAMVILRHFNPVEMQGPSAILRVLEAEDWWKHHEADLRRRAAQLPR